MQRKGYFNATVETKTKFKDKKKTVKVDYTIAPGELYFVDSMYLRTSNSSVRASYEKYLKNGENVLIPPFRFDSDALAKMRKSMSDFMKNNALYGFKESYEIGRASCRERV